jgi:hypothetical protein
VIRNQKDERHPKLGLGGTKTGSLHQKWKNFSTTDEIASANTPKNHYFTIKWRREQALTGGLRLMMIWLKPDSQINKHVMMSSLYDDVGCRPSSSHFYDEDRAAHFHQ